VGNHRHHTGDAWATGLRCHHRSDAVGILGGIVLFWIFILWAASLFAPPVARDRQMVASGRPAHWGWRLAAVIMMLGIITLISRLV